MNNTLNSNSAMSTKSYIGHGTKHSQFDLIDVVLNMTDIEEHTFEYEGKRYLKMTVAARKEPSTYGATHTVYIRKRAQQPAEEQVAEPQPEAPAKPARKRNTKRD